MSPIRGRQNVRPPPPPEHERQAQASAARTAQGARRRRQDRRPAQAPPRTAGTAARRIRGPRPAAPERRRKRALPSRIVRYGPRQAAAGRSKTPGVRSWSGMGALPAHRGPESVPAGTAAGGIVITRRSPSRRPRRRFHSAGRAVFAAHSLRQRDGLVPLERPRRPRRRPPDSPERRRHQRLVLLASRERRARPGPRGRGSSTRSGVPRCRRAGRNRSRAAASTNGFAFEEVDEEPRTIVAHGDHALRRHRSARASWSRRSRRAARRSSRSCPRSIARCRTKRSRSPT